MPIFCPSPRTKLKFLYPVEKVTPFRILVPCPVLLTHKSVLIAADDALKIAATTQSGYRSSKVDKKFGDVIDLLSGFEKDFPLKDPMSDPNIRGTTTRETSRSDKFKSPSTILSALKKNLHAKVMFPSVSLLLDAYES